MEISTNLVRLSAVCKDTDNGKDNQRDSNDKDNDNENDNLFEISTDLVQLDCRVHSPHVGVLPGKSKQSTIHQNKDLNQNLI